MIDEQKTLLLNASYEPLAIVSWRRAITLLFLHKIETLEYYNHKIHSATKEWKLPAVVRLTFYVRYKFHPIKFSRANIYLRDHYTCQYCGSTFAPAQLTCDHVIPKSRGGETDWTNIVTCCLRCNNRKRDLTPAEAGMTLISKPKRPNMPQALKLVLGMKSTPEAWKKYLFQE